jgi:TolB-like protein
MGPFLFSGHTLDVERRELRRDNTPVAIEPQVFDLLVYLLTNRHRVVSKDDVLDSVWSGRIVSESALTTRIAAARRAIGDSGETQTLIRTIARKGFRFVGEVREDDAEARHAVMGGAMPVGAAAPLMLPDKPSIAVLAFTNMSPEPDQQFLADGLADDIITELSRDRALFVIARNSSFTYQGRSVDVRQVARELGVRYVLEGSVRRSGERIRVNVQLIDAEAGNHVWAERYDRRLIELFDVQDDITGVVALAIRPAIADAEQRRVLGKPPENLRAWECYHRGLWHYAQLDVHQNEVARGFLTRAIELDPGFAAAYSATAVTYFTEATNFRPFSQRSQLLPTAADFARRSIALDNADARGHSALAYTLMLLGGHEEAMAEANLAVALDRNSAWAAGAQGFALAFGGFPRDGIESLRIALRLSPFDPLVSRWQHHMARGYYFAEDYQAAIALARQVCRSSPDFRPIYRTLIAALGQAGRSAEAQNVFSEAMERFGKDTFPPLGTRMRELSEENYDHMVDGYTKAGVL